MFEKDVTYVTIPAHDGQIGLAYNRAPLLVELGEGALTLTDSAGKRESYQLSGGFAQMLNNKLTILTNTATAEAAG